MAFIIIYRGITVVNSAGFRPRDFNNFYLNFYSYFIEIISVTKINFWPTNEYNSEIQTKKDPSCKQEGFLFPVLAGTNLNQPT